MGIDAIWLRISVKSPSACTILFRTQWRPLSLSLCIEDGSTQAARNVIVSSRLRTKTHPENNVKTSIGNTDLLIQKVGRNTLDTICPSNESHRCIIDFRNVNQANSHSRKREWQREWERVACWSIDTYHI